jgi:hypothetical protein
VRNFICAVFWLGWHPEVKNASLFELIFSLVEDTLVKESLEFKNITFEMQEDAFDVVCSCAATCAIP